MARYPFGTPRIEVIDPPAGEGFYIHPASTREPASDSDLEDLEIHLQKKGDNPRIFTAMLYVTVARYTARVTTFAIQNIWGEGTFRVVYVRRRANQSAYSSPVTVQWTTPQIPD